MRAVLIDDLSGAVILTCKERVRDGENRIVACGGNIQHIPEEIESKAGGTNYQRRRIGAVQIARSDLSFSVYVESVSIEVHGNIQPGHRSTQNVRDEYLGK